MIIDEFESEQIVIEMSRYTCKECGTQIYLLHRGNQDLIDLKCRGCGNWFMQIYNKEQIEQNILNIQKEMI